MPRYQVKGEKLSTGRKTTRTYECSTMEIARARAEDPDYKIHDIVEVPLKPPTEQQLARAKEAGIAVPPGITSLEMTDLIYLKTSTDKLADGKLRELAEGYGALVSKYSGKRKLFSRIFDELRQAGREQELAGWFAYRVYRELVKGAPDAPIASPHDPRIVDIPHKLAANESVVKSILKYEPTDLVYFGQWTASSGAQYQGGSNRTIAYKAAAELLRPIVAAGNRAAAVARATRELERPAPPPIRIARPTEVEGLGLIRSLLNSLFGRKAK